MEEREEKWNFRHEDNILWAAGITNTIAEVMKAAASDQAAREKAVERSANDHQQVMTSWRMAMDARYVETKNQMQALNDKLDGLGEEQRRREEMPNDAVMSQMAEVLCEKICTISKAKQKQIGEGEEGRKESGERRRQEERAIERDAAKGKEQIRRDVQKALGITDMEIEENEEQKARVEKQVEVALEMEIESQGLEDSRHAPEIAPGGFKPVETATATMPTAKPMMIQLRGKAKPTLIAVPEVRKPKAPENAPKGPKADIRENMGTKPAKGPTTGAPKKQPQIQTEIRKPTYAEKLAASATGQNKRN
jgi:hypothetical protein